MSASSASPNPLPFRTPAPQPEPAGAPEPVPPPPEKPAEASRLAGSQRPPRPAGKPGLLQLLPSRVTGAVSVDGKTKGRFPHEAYELPAGTHVVRLENTVGHVITRTVTVRPGQTVELEFAREDFGR